MIIVVVVKIAVVMATVDSHGERGCRFKGAGVTLFFEGDQNIIS